MTPARSPFLRTRLGAIALATAAALAFASCGSEESTSDAATDPNSADRLTAEEFVAALEDDKQAYVEKVTAGVPDCVAVTDRGFLLLVAARATETPPEEPVDDLVLDACSP